MVAGDGNWVAIHTVSVIAHASEKQAPSLLYVTAHYALSIIQLIAAIYYHQMEGVNRTGTRIVKRDIMLDKGATLQRRRTTVVVSALERG